LDRLVAFERDRFHLQLDHRDGQERFSRPRSLEDHLGVLSRDEQKDRLRVRDLWKTGRGAGTKLDLQCW